MPAIKATSGAGRKCDRRRGQRKQTASVTAPIATALALMSPSASGNARIAPTAPPGTTGVPRNGKTWITMMMMPMPDMNPEMTTCGV